MVLPNDKIDSTLCEWQDGGFFETPHIRYQRIVQWRDQLLRQSLRSDTISPTINLAVAALQSMSNALIISQGECPFEIPVPVEQCETGDHRVR